MQEKRPELRIQKSLSQVLIKKAKRIVVLPPAHRLVVPPILLLDQSIYEVAALKAATFLFLFPHFAFEQDLEICKRF